MNHEAFQALRIAEVTYLKANGWKEAKSSEGLISHWTEPKGRKWLGTVAEPRTLVHGHAVNSQKAKDTSALAGFIDE